MQIETTNTKEDYLEFLMYNSTLSSSDTKKRKQRRFLIPLVYLIFGIVVFTTSKIFGIILFLFSILWFLFYPKFIQKKYKKSYTKYIQESYEKRLNTKVKLKLDSEFIHTEDEGSESKIKISEVDRIVELKNLMLIYISKTSAIVIPKRHLNSQKEFEDFFKDLNVRILDEMAWKWNS